MKKLIIALMLVCMILSIISCDSNESPDNLAKERDLNNSADAHISNQSNDETSLDTEPNNEEPTEDELLESGNSKADSFYIEELIRAYENSMIDAFNNNDFTYVEKFLVYESEIYDSHKRLISKSNSENITKKLIDYNIHEIVESDIVGVYNVYVIEQIATKTSEKDFETEEFRWIYTVIYNGETLGISDSEKWNE